ncbi:helix-turn-helix transcriptional regulator [Microbacteriaceae bacterium VKM Ac-2854]|nr:helix-turn-helix transcriptional regulator [Microbacteriaceae bacterium VKM Ac-2854]
MHDALHGDPEVRPVISADPVTLLLSLPRYRLVAALIHSGPATCTELATRLALNATTVRSHLRALAGAGLLKTWVPVDSIRNSRVYAVNSSALSSAYRADPLRLAVV